MKTKYLNCPQCEHTHKVEIPENFDDKVQKFVESAPESTTKSLLSLAAGVFVAPPAGLLLVHFLFLPSLMTEL